MNTDPISDLLTRIKNGYMAHKENIAAPHSKMKEALVKVLLKAGYIANVSIEKIDKNKKNLIIELSYENKKPKVTQIVKVSKPGKKVYSPKNKIPKVLGGLGTSIVSTSQGIMTDKEAKRKGIGGEVLCKIW